MQNGQDPFLQQPNFFFLLLLLHAVDRQWEKRSSLRWQQHADLCVVLVFAGVFLVAAAAAGAGHAGGAVAQLVAGALYVGTAGAVAFALLAFCITLPGTQWGVPWLITLFPMHPSPPPCLFVSPCQVHGGGVNMTSPPPPPFPSPLTNSHYLKTSRPYFSVSDCLWIFSLRSQKKHMGLTYSSFSFMGLDLQSNFPTGPEDERHRD